MNVSGVSFNGQVNTKAKSKDKPNIAGSLGAAAASTAVTTITPIALRPTIYGMGKISQSLAPDEIKKLNEAAQQVLNNKTNLAQKGVEIIDLRQGTAYGSGPINDVINGKNAFFTSKPLQMGTKTINANSVVVNASKMPQTQLHELGHAFNYNNSAFWKTMQKARTPGMLLASFFALFPAFTKETKAKEGEELTKGQKFKNGLRKASPLLAVGAMMPTILEEGMASLRAHNWAKGLLDKNLLKKVDKTNLLGLVSYVGLAAGMGIASYAARKIKDKSQEKRALKVQQMMQAPNTQDVKKQTKVN